MSIAILAGVGGAPIVFLGVFLICCGRPKAGRETAGNLTGWAGRLREARARSVAVLGPVGGFVLFFGAGVFVTAAVGIALGEALARLEGPVDWPVFHWVERVQDHDSARLLDIVGKMGNVPQTRGLGAAAAVVLVFLAPSRRWVPPLLIGSVILVQKYAQTGIAKIVDRGHPPTTLGTYPSGGCARTIAIYGVVLFLVMSYARVGRRWHAAGWALIATLAFVEGYTRTYLNKHWVTDVVGGWAFGGMLLAVAVFAGRALLPSDPGRRRPAEPGVAAPSTPPHRETGTAIR